MAIKERNKLRKVPVSYSSYIESIEGHLSDLEFLAELFKKPRCVLSELAFRVLLRTTLMVTKFPTSFSLRLYLFHDPSPQTVSPLIVNLLPLKMDLFAIVLLGPMWSIQSMMPQ